jgi:predicted Na+-dependent transporter
MLQTLAELLVLVFVVSTMLGTGLMLTPRDIVASLRDRRWLVRAVLVNIVVLPALALGISHLLRLDTVSSTALLMLATAPGGPALVKTAMMAKGDTALAVGLVVCLLSVGVVTQPLLLPLLLDGVKVSAGAILRMLLFTVAAPLLLGLAVRARHPSLAAWLLLPMQRVSTVSLIFALILLPALHAQELLELASSGALPAALLFVAVCAAAGWLIGGPQAGRRRTLSLCCSQPNLAAALVIATQNFHDQRITLMLILLLIATVLILLPLIFFFARKSLAVQTAN